MPKISVIVPIYGVEKYLKECVDSILNQTLKDIEIFLIDDGSKDSCPQICDEYAKIDNRIKVIHKTNGGYGQTCNTGLDNAKGEYIAIVEPDDFIDKKMYEDLYKIAKDFDSDIVKSCFWENFQINGKSFCKKTKWDSKKIPLTRSFNSKECPLFLYYHPSIWSCIYKKEFIEKHRIRFIEAKGAGWTDNPFQVQTMVLAQRINYTDNAYYYWRRLSENSINELKDLTIPFKRSNEIHDWLIENNINASEILSCIYMREIGYMYMVLQAMKLKDYKQTKKMTEQLLNRMDIDIFKNSNFAKKRIEKQYKSLKENFYITFLKVKYDNFRRNLISIRLNKKEKRITFLGKTIQIGGK